MREAFINAPQLIEVTARRNSSLQGAYFIIAARAVGLDCGPMSGFDNVKVDEEFFAAGKCGGCDEEFLPEGHVRIQLSVQSRLRRLRKALSPQPTAEVRRGVHASVIKDRAVSGRVGALEGTRISESMKYLSGGVGRSAFP